GCLGHTEQVIELLINEKYSPDDFSGLPLTIVLGKGFEENQIENLQEPIILLGECACKELLGTLKKKYLQVDVLNTCGRCDNIVACVARNMNVDVFDLSPLSRLEVYRLFLTGRLKGLRYTIPR
ncbi:MAG: hypothetical protein HY801_02480, partial [Candidatus Lindowbacteria bacterium]|nr:hypothetical protein [Candidatus Lindowbacteria bacterium]